MVPRSQQGLWILRTRQLLAMRANNKTVGYTYEMAEMSELEEIYQKINNESGSKLTALSIRTNNGLSYREIGR